MRQVNLHGIEDLRVDETPKPEPGPRDIVLKMRCCGICGPGARCPQPLGHEAAGVVQALGAEVKGIANDMRVVVNPMSTNQVIGCGGPEGAFTDYLLVREAELGRSVFPIPDGISFAAASLVEPLAVARHGVDRADPKPGDRVVVFGAGPIGLGAVVWLRRRGVSQFAVVDLNDQRLERAKALGAPHVVNPAGKDLAAELTRILGRGQNALGHPAVDAEIYLDMAGAPSIPNQIVSMAKMHAKMVVTSSYRAPIEIDFHKVLQSELTITAAIGYPDEMGKVMAEIGELAREAEIMISHRFAFDDVLDAFKVAASADCAKVVVEFAD
jgi:2-desacetyl-2-hydroxyethyl bacteriochlorophyllide A dehydrogenase